MIYLTFFITITISATIGFIVGACLRTSKHSDTLQEAYYKGLKDGRDFVLNDVNDLYDKYKEQANEHNSN